MISAAVAVVLQTLLLASVVHIVLTVVRSRSAQLTLTCWMAVLAASLAMPLLVQLKMLPVPHWAPLSILRTSLPPLPRPRPALIIVALALYAAVTLTMLLRLLLGILRSFTLLRGAQPLRLDGSDQPRICLSAAVAGPVTLGRSILLPPGCAAWPDATLRAVVAHEWAHAMARDFYMLLASRLNTVLFWFNPTAWWLHRRLVLLAEIACDDAAIAVIGDRTSYARILIEVAAGMRQPAIGLAMARPTTIEQRLTRILDSGHPPSRGDWRRRAIATVGILCLAVAITASITVRDGPSGVRIKQRTYVPVRIPSGLLDAYAGYYRNPANGSIMIVTRAGDHLETARAGHPPVPEYPYDDHDFFLTTSARQNSFVTDGTGRAIQVVHHQKGRDEVLDRVNDATAQAGIAAVEERLVQERAPHLPYRVDPAELDRFQGSYQVDRGETILVRHHGDQLVVMIDSESSDFRPYGKTEFFCTRAAAQISFRTGLGGAVTGLVLHRDGRDDDAVRTPSMPTAY